jgi:fructose-1-phosphate kinase PfkB-like protein
LRTCTSIIETSVATGCRVTELVEPSAAVDDSCVEAMTETVQSMLPTATALVIAGSAPGFPAGYQARLAAMAGEAGVPVFLDIQGTPLREAIAARPVVVKINLAEFVASFLADRFKGGEHSGVLAEALVPPELTNAMSEISLQHATSFVLTRGANSILLVRAGEVRSVPVRPLAIGEILNPIGSGDAFLAGMLAHLLAAGSLASRSDISLDALEESFNLATACAQSNARTARPGFLEDSFSR